MYEISKKTISNESGFTLKEVDKLLPELYPKVKYSEQDNIIWVRNSVRRQFLKSLKVSPLIIKGISNKLLQLPHGHPFIKEFLNLYSILNIPYPYSFKGYPYLSGEEEGVGVSSSKALTTMNESNLYSRIIRHFNLVYNKNYNTVKVSKALKKQINARIEEGFGIEDFKYVHICMKAVWQDKEDQREYMRPQTYYTEKFSSYREKDFKHYIRGLIELHTSVLLRCTSVRVMNEYWAGNKAHARKVLPLASFKDLEGLGKRHGQTLRSKEKENGKNS